MAWQIKRFWKIWQDIGIRTALQRTLVYLSIWNAIQFWDARLKFSCDIEQPLPQSTRLAHPVGIVVNTKAEIGDNVQINQNVTIGMDEEGAPKICDDVTIFSGAIILGDVTVGEGAVIGANSVVLDDITAETTVVGAPATEVDRES